MSFLDYDPPPERRRLWIIIYGASFAILTVILVYLLLRGGPRAVIPSPRLSPMTQPAATRAANER